MRARLGSSVVAGLLVPGGGYVVRGREGRGAVVLAAALTLAVAGAFAAAGGHATAFYACAALVLLLHLGAILGAALASPGVLRSGLATLVLVLGATAIGYGTHCALRRWVVEMFRVPSVSMAPTIARGERIVADKRARTPRRGDVIVFHVRNADGYDVAYVKRVIAVGGDRIAFRDDVPILNGRALPQILKSDGAQPGSRVLAETLAGRSYDVLRTHDPTRDVNEVLLAPDELYVVGDNRDESNDSRFIGPVKQRDVIGTARFVWLGLTADRTGAEIL